MASSGGGGGLIDDVDVEAFVYSTGIALKEGQNVCLILNGITVTSCVSRPIRVQKFPGFSTHGLNVNIHVFAIRVLFQVEPMGAPYIYIYIYIYTAAFSYIIHVLDCIALTVQLFGYCNCNYGGLSKYCQVT